MAKRVSIFSADGARRHLTHLSYRAIVAFSIYLPIAIGIMILGSIFGAMGVELVYLGAKGNTSLKLFGQTMETTDVGVASIFIGAVTVVFVIRRVLKSIENIKDE